MTQTTIKDLPAELIRDELFKHIVTMLDARTIYSSIIVFRKSLTREYIESIKPLFLKRIVETIGEETYTYYAYPNGVKHGECTVENSKYKKTNTYINGLLQGTYVLTYHISGTIFTGKYVDYKIQGVVLGYYPTGEKRYYQVSRDGKYQGFALEYYKNGQLKSRYNFKDGYISGQYIRYNINGRVESRDSYLNSHKNGRCISYRNDGKIHTIMMFKDDKQDGPYKIFYSNGRVSKEGEYINDEDHVTAMYGPRGNLLGP